MVEAAAAAALASIAAAAAAPAEGAPGDVTMGFTASPVPCALAPPVWLGRVTSASSGID